MRQIRKGPRKGIHIRDPKIMAALDRYQTTAGLKSATNTAEILLRETLADRGFMPPPTKGQKT